MEPSSLPELGGWTWWSEEQSQLGCAGRGVVRGLQRELHRSVEVPSSWVHLSTSAGHGGNSLTVREKASRSARGAGNSSCSHPSE